MNRITGIVLAAAGLLVLDQAGQAQTNAGTVPFDRLSASRTAIARSNDRTAPSDTVAEIMASASAGGNCRDAKGNFVEVFNPQNNLNTGTIFNAGWLNGATEGVVDTAGFLTPDPNKFSYGSPISIATRKGVLKGRRVFVSDIVTGFGMDMTDIDPKTSTGMFAGATGVLYVHVNKSVTVDTGPYYQEIAAHVCFALGREAPDQ
jgi:hypothetical protein